MPMCVSIPGSSMHVPIPITIPVGPLDGLSKSLSVPADPLVVEPDPVGH